MGSPIETLIRDTVTKGVEAPAGYNRKRLPVPEGDNPFLTGIHAPMTDELTLTELPVTGTIPVGLDGRYLRIGPDPIDADPTSYHWFMGDGMVHGLAIEDGRALWYRNRWIRSNFGVDRHPGEFIFVPETPDSREGHGWLIGLVVDMAQQTTDLVILDACRFEEAPVAGIRLPHRIPPGFQGNRIAKGEGL